MKRISHNSHKVLKYIYNSPGRQLHEEHIYVSFGIHVADSALAELRRTHYVGKSLPAYFDYPRAPEDDILFVTEAGELYLAWHKRHTIIGIAGSLLDFALSFLPWKPEAGKLVRSAFHDDSEG